MQEGMKPYIDDFVQNQWEAWNAD